MLRILVLLVIASLQLVQAATVAESLRAWRPDRRIQVSLNSGDKLTGRVGVIQSDRFTLEPDNKRATAREIKFDEVRSVKTKMTRTTKWIIAGAIYLGLVGLSALNN